MPISPVVVPFGVGSLHESSGNHVVYELYYDTANWGQKYNKGVSRKLSKGVFTLNGQNIQKVESLGLYCQIRGYNGRIHIVPFGQTRLGHICNMIKGQLP